MKSDEELIADIRRGSRAAFETLFERYRQPVWQFFRRRTRRPEVAEELSQDTFLAVLEGAGRYEQRGTFRSYLFGIAYNVLLADRRKSIHPRHGGARRRRRESGVVRPGSGHLGPRCTRRTGRRHARES